MRILESDLNDEVTLRGSAISSGFVIGPGKLGRNGHVGAAADAGHGSEKSLEARGIGIHGSEHICFAVRSFILAFAGAQGSGEVVPVLEEALVGHLQHAADVGGLVLVEEEIG